jgi:betaine-aldehyde dehydrogenase
MADTSFQNIVNGESVPSASGETYDVVDPTTGETYATAPLSGREDLDRAYGAAERAFESWGESTPQDRSNALLKLAEAIDARIDEINEVECRDTGKPRGLTM